MFKFLIAKIEVKWQYTLLNQMYISLFIYIIRRIIYAYAWHYYPSKLHSALKFPTKVKVVTIQLCYILIFTYIFCILWNIRTHIRIYGTVCLCHAHKGGHSENWGWCWEIYKDDIFWVIANNWTFRCYWNFIWNGRTLAVSVWA